ncbi:glycoside hydrolase superfamily [Blyttiomyces helicus]|uniref:cellulase n=1 Tax=Blyttiomyces helicus TaxID=388810 RepID=A0A4P9VX30_9FUNG|nr:glycoside hydrolase superfamily [Blyttiomyces helicus]|eukprot:RKO84264.1 glycoside hydrolase superfamily [Blyttiomyces helicus]
MRRASPHAKTLDARSRGAGERKNLLGPLILKKRRDLGRQPCPSLSLHPPANPLPLIAPRASEAGLDFGAGAYPGAAGTNFFTPNPAAIADLLAIGANTIRLPFLWERTRGGGSIGYYNQIIGQGVPTSAFTNLWTQLATRYASSPLVIFALMNEPHNMGPASTWFAIAQSALTAIRATGATNLALVPGTCYTGAHDWDASYCLNGAAAVSITDPNYAFEVHRYFDSDFPGPGLIALTGNGFLGEFAFAASVECLGKMEAVLEYLDANGDVWVGWAWWAAGPAWGAYPFSIESTTDEGDPPQMAVLERHFAGGTGGNSSAGPRTTASATTSTVTTTTTTNPTATIANSASAAAIPSSPATATSQGACASLYGQCGGISFTGPTCCQAETACVVLNPYYSQCIPIPFTSITAITATAIPTTSATTTTTTTTTKTLTTTTTTTTILNTTTTRSSPAGSSSTSTSTTMPISTITTTTPPSYPCGPVYSQCGGISFAGPTCWQPGSTCTFQNPYYSQCLPATTSTTSTWAAVYAQCGGTGFAGPTCCVVGAVCTFSSQYHSQCLPK